MKTTNRVMWGMTASTLATALALSACGGDDGSGDQSDDPIVIGISLPLTGDFSEPGTGVQRGTKRGRASSTSKVACSAGRSSCGSWTTSRAPTGSSPTTSS